MVQMVQPEIVLHCCSGKEELQPCGRKLPLGLRGAVQPGGGWVQIRAAPPERCLSLFGPKQPTHPLANHGQAWSGATGVQLAAGGRYAGVNSAPGVEASIRHISHLLQVDPITCRPPGQVFPPPLTALRWGFLFRYLWPNYSSIHFKVDFIPAE